MKDFGSMKIVTKTKNKGKENEEYEIKYGEIDFKPSIENELNNMINNNISAIQLKYDYDIILSDLNIDFSKFNYENINPYECLYTFEFITKIGGIPFECKIDDAWISRFSNIREMTLETRATSRLIIKKLTV